MIRIEGKESFMTVFTSRYKLFVLFSFMLLVASSLNIQKAKANFISKFFKQRIQEIFAPRSLLWEKWKKRNQENKKKISHELWGSVLSKNLFLDPKSKINLFNYKKISKEDREKLNLYIKKLESFSISKYSWVEQKAYWINLYNAVTVQLIIKHYPLKTIKNIEIIKNHAKFGPWDAKILKIENVLVSLNDIEHRILRPLAKDPRIHYALNCASIGCPSLNKVPFTSKNTENLLEKSSFDFVNHPRGVSFKKGELHVSSLYIWFRSDFLGDGLKGDEGVINHLKKYAKGSLKKMLDKYQEDIIGHSYNWNLNSLEKK